MNERLLDAALRGDIDMVRQFLVDGADINHEDNDGNTVLSLASQNGHLAVVEHLMANGADANRENEMGKTALVLALYNGHLAIAERLVANGADVNRVNNYGETALMRASMSMTGRLAVVEFLTAHGANVNCEKTGNTALMMASRGGHLLVVRHLVVNGLDVNHRNKYGSTAIMWASLGGHLAVVEYLMANGADLNYTTVNGSTALILSWLHRHVAVTRYLLARHFESDECVVDQRIFKCFPSTVQRQCITLVTLWSVRWNEGLSNAFVLLPLELLHLLLYTLLRHATVLLDETQPSIQ